eukprot:gene26069-11772_t
MSRYGVGPNGVAVNPENLKRNGMGGPPPDQGRYVGPNGISVDPESIYRPGMGGPSPDQGRYVGPNGISLDPENIHRQGMGGPPPQQGRYVGPNGISLDPENIHRQGMGGPPPQQGRYVGPNGIPLDPEDVRRPGIGGPPPDQGRYVGPNGISSDPENIHRQGMGGPPPDLGRYVGPNGISVDPENIDRQGMPPPPPSDQRQYGLGPNVVAVDPENLPWQDPDEMAWRQNKLIPQNPNRHGLRHASNQPSPHGGPPPKNAPWHNKPPAYQLNGPIPRDDSVNTFMHAHKHKSPPALRIPAPGDYGYGADQQNNSPAAGGNNDGLGQVESGITGAHNQKDGISAFEGYYGRAHAGKTNMSSLGYKEQGLSVAEEDSLGQFRQQHQKPQYSGVAAAMGANEAGNAPPGHLPSVRTYQGAKQKKDNLVIQNGGLTSLEGSEAAQRPLRGQHGMGGRGRGSSIQVSENGISSNGGVLGANMPGKGGQAGRQISSLVNKDGGMMQQGEALLRQGPYAGKSQFSNLKQGDGGMGALPGGQQNANRHAGKITESSLMQKTNGISILPQEQTRANSYGNGHWATTHDEAYKLEHTPANSYGNGHWATTHDEAYKLVALQQNQQQNQQAYQLYCFHPFAGCTTTAADSASIPTPSWQIEDP